VEDTALIDGFAMTVGVCFGIEATGELVLGFWGKVGLVFDYNDVVPV
jgi:hypothetical protein